MSRRMLETDCWRTHAREGIIETERLNVTTKRLTEIGNCFLLRHSFAICRNIRHTRCKTPIVWIGNQLNGGGYGSLHTNGIIAQREMLLKEKLRFGRLVACPERRRRGRVVTWNYFR